MREITITKNNIASVYDKIHRFYSSRFSTCFKSYHNFDCGFKKHMKPYHEIVRTYENIECVLHTKNVCNSNYYNPWIIINLGPGEGFSLKEGDKILIGSKRIMIRTKFYVYGHTYLYQVFDKVNNQGMLY